MATADAARWWSDHVGDAAADRAVFSTQLLPLLRRACHEHLPLCSTTPLEQELVLKFCIGGDVLTRDVIHRHEVKRATIESHAHRLRLYKICGAVFVCVQFELFVARFGPVHLSLKKVGVLRISLSLVLQLE